MAGTSVARPQRPAQSARNAGYSGTALVDKLGIKADARLQFVGAPPSFFATLGERPQGSRIVGRGPLDFALLFVTARSELVKSFPRLRDRLVANGMLWVSWPKKASGVTTDLSEGIVRTIGLELGLVDVKVCAVDETWSGLKFVRRLKDR
ncbi:MAG: DUF3052 domain-containing protein [Gemmatimonadaceae bacterium]